MQILHIKIISTGAIFISTLLGGFLPFVLLRKLLNRTSSAESKLCILRCIAGGIFLGTCLTDLLPEAHEAMETAFGDTGYPAAEACAGVGFLVMYAVENLMLTCHPHHSGVQDSEVTVKYTTQYDTQTVEKVKRYGSLDESDSGGESAVRNMDKESVGDESVSDTEQLLDSGIVDVVLNVDKTNNINKKEPQSSVDLNSFRTYVLFIALSFHTVFDGLVVGIQKSASLAWTLLVAMSIHKALVAVSLGLSFLDSHAKKPLAALLYLLCFSLVTPIGCGIGIALTEIEFNSQNQKYAAGFLQSFATGTFMFVTFFECLKDELLGKRPFVKVTLVIIGFSVVAGLKFVVRG